MSLLRFECFPYGVAATNYEMMLFYLKFALQEVMHQFIFQAFCVVAGVISFHMIKPVNCVSHYGVVHQPTTKFTHSVNLFFIIFTEFCSIPSHLVCVSVRSFVE